MHHPFVSGKEGFFKEKACVNCSIDNYCACDGADILFGIEGVMRKELVDVGQGAKMAEPIKAEKRPMTGGRTSTSLSKGCLLFVPAHCSVHRLQRHISGFRRGHRFTGCPRLIVSEQL